MDYLYEHISVEFKRQGTDTHIDNQSNEKHGKDLDNTEYSEWIARLSEVRYRWKYGVVGEEKILMVVQKLDQALFKNFGGLFYDKCCTSGS